MSNVTQQCRKDVELVEPMPWTLFFYGSACKQGIGVIIVIVSPRGARFKYALPITSGVRNNQVEYEAILKVLQMLQEVKDEVIDIFGDSQLFINELLGIYECKDEVLSNYLDKCHKLFGDFLTIYIRYIRRAQNEEANRSAQNASGYQTTSGIYSNETINDDWRKEIANYL